ncbi:Mu-like prophage major head subunit gpT family protein [Variovorax sp.]|uniref:Mu-like prophage major head subunit gpT family protein n=1 Tax=Variovorax sp. TaxID=1871043 RepID=UPI003BAB2ACB
MEINQANLRNLFVAYRSNFQSGLGQAASQYLQIATEVPSTTGETDFGWLGQLPDMREWIGDRVVHGIGTHDYSIKNREFELTIGVKRKTIEDDQFGVYAPMFVEMGRSAAAHPDRLVFELLTNGRSMSCYDGKPFFATNHPVLNEKGKAEAMSNVDDDGTGPSWYVMDTSRALKPLIFQNRKAPNFVAKDKETDDNVFDKGEFKYGTDRRGNAGFGFWQLAQACDKELNAENLEAQITTLGSRTGDHGRPLGISANLLVVAPRYEFKAARLVESENLAVAGGTESNPLKGRLKVLVAPWLK